MIILVCGGRTYNNEAMVYDIMSVHVTPNDIVVQGGAEGADALASDWCWQQGVACATVWAHWNRYKKQAGHIRNGWMLRLKPDKVIAFPGGRGTADMVRQAKEAGIEVIEID